MVKNTKKIISLLLVVIMMVAVFCACGNEKLSKGNVVRIWSTDGSGQEVWKQLVEEFNDTIGKEKGITIEFTTYLDNYKNILETACQSNQAADLFPTPGTLSTYVDKGYIAPITKLPGFENAMETYKDYLVDNKTTVNGELYALPSTAQTYGLIYNKDMFKAAGIVDENGEATPPKTWDEYVEYAKKLTNPEKNEYGTIYPVKWSGFWSYETVTPFSASFAINSLNRNTMEYEYEKYAPMWEAIRQVKKDGSCVPGSEGIDNDYARAQFANGNIGMKMAVSWDVGVFTSQFPVTCDWGVAPVPILDENERYVQPATYGLGMRLSAAVTDDRLDDVAVVYEWLNSDEVSIRLYEEEISFPYDMSIVENADESKVSPQWKAFKDILTYSTTFKETYGNALPTEQLQIDSHITDKDEYEKIWATDADIKSILRNMEKVKTEDLRNAFKKAGLNIDDYKYDNTNRKIQ